MRQNRRKQLVALGVTAALAATPIIGDEILAASLIGGIHMDETTSAQRERRRTGERGASGATPKYVGFLVVGMVAILAAQVLGLRGFVQH